ncbi:MAG: acetoin utilization protein AcuB [Gammaproteobacteria bacterium]|nr:MAG: acetoin utilization protein AcuB [Gammaproteobacteria bacterium]
MITVDEVMVRTLYTLGPDASVFEARTMMERKNIRHIPIVANGDGDILLGIVTQRDLLAASSSSLRLLSVDQRTKLERSHKVREVMTRKVHTIDERDSLKSAALLLRKHKYGCLPVVTEGKLRGLVTDTDFVGIAVHLIEQMEEMSGYDDVSEVQFDVDDLTDESLLKKDFA